MHMQCMNKSFCLHLDNHCGPVGHMYIGHIFGLIRTKSTQTTIYIGYVSVVSCHDDYTIQTYYTSRGGYDWSWLVIAPTKEI